MISLHLKTNAWEKPFAPEFYNYFSLSPYNFIETAKFGRVVFLQ